MPVRTPDPFPSSLRPLGVWALLTAGACGTGPTAPEASSPHPPAGTVTVTLTHPGDTASLALGAGAVLTVTGETRYLHDLPVLDPARLASGRLRAGTPGTATVRVDAPGRAPEQVTVHVRPARPLVLSASVAFGVAGEDTVLLRGYRLSDVEGSAVAVGGTPGRRVGGDSATLRVLVPALADGACTSGALRQEVSAQGADVVPELTVPRTRRGDLRLRVGQAVRLGAGEIACLRFAPLPGARYALAFLDTRKLREAEAGFEGYAPTPLHYEVSVAEAGSAAPLAASTLQAPRTASSDVVRAGTAAGGSTHAALVQRTLPWREGERFPLQDPDGSGTVTARVVRVYGGHLVLAVEEGEEAAGGTGSWLARADTAFAQAVESGYPLLRAALSPSLPVTSPGSGQLLVLARRTPGGHLGTSVTVSVDGRKRSYALLNTAYETTAAGLLKTLAHELAHAWQEEYARETRPAGATGSGAATAWSTEGNAELLASVIAARVHRIALTGNWEWAGRLGDTRYGAYALFAANTRGDFTQGYESGASFQLDLATRLVRSGKSEDEALATVSRGALDGWYGYDAHGGKREGLVARMRRSLDAGWEPADALLRWTLSQAVDDLTADPEFQNHAFRRVSTAGDAPAMGWIPPVVLRSGDRAVRGDPAGPTAVAGNAGSIRWRYGSPNYFLVEDGGFGGAYRLGASGGGAPLPGMAWMVIRYQ
ncbi:MAG TPA: hypothetical protein VHG28_07190 [Longimicrobiaceae bacterium]|nr:hypothetical protein [Longimicrobiaceae bacterium]